jgi:anthranilate synthase component 1
MKKHTIYTSQKHLLCDTKTPVSLFLALRDSYCSPLLLESSDYNSKNNHYSFLCFEPLASISIHKQIVKTSINDVIEKKSMGNNSESLNSSFNHFLNSFQFDKDLSQQQKGVFGYCSFNIASIASELTFKNNETEIPELLYHLYAIVLVFNHSTNELNIHSHSFSKEKADLNLIEVRDKIELNKHHNYPFSINGEEKSNLSDNEFLANIKKAKNNCKLGEVFQLVISRRFVQNYKGDDFNVYRALKKINPSPYLFYFDTGSFRIFGSSPEAQLKISNNETEIHPIAGTYKRTGNDVFDLEKSKELLEDEKENAEHIMLVDLARNDLNKYSKNVTVKSLKQIQFYSHVIHMVSKVTGQLRNEFTPFDVLAGTFPAGTLSGAPKHRALQLIDEIENSPRSFYGGTIGFVGQKGELNQAIIIRSFLSKNNQLIFQAGAGVVVSSIEENELQEVYNKTNALRLAIKEASKLN